MPGLNTITNRIRSINVKDINYKDPKVLVIIALSFLILAGLLALLLVKKPFSPQSPAITPTVQVSITKTGFVPATISVAKGTKVVFTNTDTTSHQIEANPHPTGNSLPELKSEILNNKQTYEYTFTQTGTFTYHDHLNPMVNGTVEVK